MFDTFPILHTDRLDLIEIKQAHLGDIYKLFSNSQVTQFYNIETLTKKEEAQKIIDWFSSRFADQVAVRWGIALKEQSSIIGTIGFNNITQKHRANLGYDLHVDFWNQGYITEALKTVIDFGFKELHINRVEAEVMHGNIVSEMVLSKSGFTKEGILRQWMYWNGNYYDMSMFSLLQSDLGV